MDYSAANVELWNGIIQLAIIGAALLAAHFLRRVIPFVRKSLMPTAVLAGFILLILKATGVLKLDADFLEWLTYHGIAIGFIAMSLKVPERTAESKGNLTGIRSGAVIVGTYMIQGLVGLGVTLLLAKTFMPDLFPASGVLLPMGYGQGPGQANNIGSSFEALGFTGGRSFGLAIAAAGYLCACTVGVIYINYIVKSGKFKKAKGEDVKREEVIVSTFQSKDEAPISESIDRFSIQVALVILVYLATFLLTKGICALLGAVAPGLLGTVESLLWGFNFIIGAALAILVRFIFAKLRKNNVMTTQYQNNYLLSRISGLAFDLMITAGIASIDFGDLSGLWIPFILLVILGAVFTFIHLRYVCKKVYGDYYYEGLVSMYGMMTGTISSGVLLLREIDPDLKTPAANNLVLGSSFGILLGAPLLVLISLASRSYTMALISLGLLAVYYVLMLLLIHLRRRKKTETEKKG
jgi:ESS family glutamate:Na+ symporter